MGTSKNEQHPVVSGKGGRYAQKTAKKKKPFYKRVWFWVVAVLLIAMIGGGSGEAAPAADTTPAMQATDPATVAAPEATPATEAAAEPETEPETEAPQVTETAAGSALDFDVSFFRLLPERQDRTLAQGIDRNGRNPDQYAVDYYREYFQSDDEVHVVYNFSLNTVNCIRLDAGTLFVSVTEYVENEEHDASEACGGQFLGQYHFNPETGEMTYNSFE